MKKNTVANKSSEKKGAQPAVKQFWERREIAYTDKRIKALDEATKVLEEKQKRSEKRERIIVYSLLSLAAAFAFSIWLTNGRVIDSVAGFLQSFEASLINTSKNEAINCRQDRNKNTPYCSSRKGKKDGDWQNIMRSKNLDKNQFSLYK